MSQSFPLTAMEEFFFWDDRPAYPCSCFFRLRFAGRLDRAAFETAVKSVMARHPMFCAKIEPVGRNRLQWTLVDNPEPIIAWQEAPVGGPLPPASHLDLRREIGIRFHVRAEAAASDVTLQFHHACCDGAGIALFIRELLVAYAVAFGAVPKRTRLLPLEPARLAARGCFGLTLWKLLRMAPKQMVGLLGARQFLMRQPVPIIPHQVRPNDAPLPGGYPATLSRALDRDTTARLRKVAARRGVTPNDLMARDLFLALAEWRSRQNIADEGQWLRMMIPMNLRTTDDRLLPAADVVSSVFLDRRGPDFADADRLLQGIHEEMSLIKRLQLGFTFVLSMAVCRRLFGGLKKKVLADKCTISCVFTNIGSPLAHVPLPQHDRCIVAGNLTLVDVDFVAPIHPYSCASFAVGLYAHKMYITLHYDPRPLTGQQAADLFETFVRHIEASIAAMPDADDSERVAARAAL